MAGWWSTTNLADCSIIGKGVYPTYLPYLFFNRNVPNYACRYVHSVIALPLENTRVPLNTEAYSPRTLQSTRVCRYNQWVHLPVLSRVHARTQSWWMVLAFEITRVGTIMTALAFEFTRVATIMTALAFEITRAGTAVIAFAFEIARVTHNHNRTCLRNYTCTCYRDCTRPQYNTCAMSQVWGKSCVMSLWSLSS